MKKLKLVVPAVLLTISAACFAAACNQVPKAHAHTYAAEWSYNESYHWHNANCAHTEKSLDTATHVYTQKEVAISCTEGAYTLYECECGYSYKANQGGQGLGHVMVTYAARQATCSLNGWDAYTACSRCGYEEGTHKVYTASGQHTIVKHNGQEATHYEDGWEAYETCSLCGEYNTFKAIPSESLHVYDGNVCTICSSEYPLSQKLAFKEGTTTCSVTGIGDYVGSVLRIPKTHNGKSVTALEKGAFKGNEKITKVIVPGNVVDINAEAFYGCKNLQEVEFTSVGTKKVGIAAFSGCEKLESINLPSSLEKIKECAFQECALLKEVDLPASLGEIGYQAFKGCVSLTEIVVPAKVTLIDYNLFMNCTALKSVTLGAKVTNIKWQAFYGCAALTEITLPSALEEIGQSAFEKTGLTSIVFPANLTYIATRAFKGCKLTSATFTTTAGWKIAANVALNADALTDAELAAQLLTQETPHAELGIAPVNEFWKRG